jgi:iron(III) transport system ATP-binding protein
MFLDIRHLEVRYAAGHGAAPDFQAVDGVSLGLQAGEIGVLIGPSGCGKTTLLRAVAGLERVQGGSIVLADEVVSSMAIHRPAEERRIGMVFQDYTLFPHMDVGQNVAFGISHLSKARRLARVEDVLALVGLQGMEKRLPHMLSGGQQQRVALARALAPSPRLLLLDEPFSSLDVDLRERLAHEVREILKAAGATALFVTHDQLEAFAIGDRIGVMHQGTLHQWDAAYALYHRPATRFVADFIGHGVFAPARIERQAGGRVVHTALGAFTDRQLRAADSARDADTAGSPGMHTETDTDTDTDMLLRADDIVHDDSAPTRAKILRRAFRGSEFLYTLQLQSGQTLLAHVPSHHDHAVGEWIGIRAEVDHVVTFPRA